MSDIKLTPAERKQAFDFLHSKAAAQSKNGFVQSVFTQLHKKKRALTDRQLFYINKAAAKTQERQASKPQENIGGNLKAVVDILNHAKKHKKFPRIILGYTNPYGGGLVKIQLYLAGTTSKYPGWLQIKGRYSTDPWYGRVNPETGALHRSAAMTPELLEVLKDFATDPLQAAQAYGGLTGECCFCSRTLTDPESKAHGYGPVCAKNHGLA